MASTTTLDQALGPYRLRERIAVGGMGEVYRAFDTRSGEPVAVKVGLPQHRSKANFLKNVTREARLQQQVTHPNLVRLRDFGEVDGSPYLVMELVTGGTLSDLLDEHGRLGETVARFVMPQLLDGIGALHEAVGVDGRPLGIIHRDIKPSNVMLDASGTVKLGDFGIARSVLDSRTRTGLVRGSIAYLSPEQATQSHLDERTDLYLAGLLLFEILTGERFLQGKTEIELLRAAENPVFRSPSSLGVDPAWDPILKKALARFPEQRFASADRFRHAILSLGPAPQWHELPMARSAPALSLVEDPPEPRRRGWWLLAPVLAAGGAVAWVAQPPPLEESPTLVLKPSPPEMVEAVPEPPRSAVVPDTVFAPKLERKSESVPDPVPDKAAKPAAKLKPRSPLPSRGPEADSTPPPAVSAQPLEAPEISASTRAAEAQTKLDAALARLRTRGLRQADLDAALRADLRGFVCDDACSVDELVNRVDAVQLDRAFLQAKLARIQQRLADSPASPEVKRLSGLALQALFDGRLDEANTLLNRLDAQRQRPDSSSQASPSEQPPKSP